MISKETDNSLQELINTLYKIRRSQKADDETIYILASCKEKYKKFLMT